MPPPEDPVHLRELATVIAVLILAELVLLLAVLRLLGVIGR
jgi:hypothetical protein